ncbi:MAG: YgiQ family radical SAM protein, partial [Flavobacteriaceae bacterium]|nr:YgiQ family radical SAM protein [Flavobacteriaceae bacterium]
FFFWYKKENKAWIKSTLSKLGRGDLLEVLLPENNSWRKNKVERAKNTFDETVTEIKEPRRKNSRKRKNTFDKTAIEKKEPRRQNKYKRRRKR